MSLGILALAALAAIAAALASRAGAVPALAFLATAGALLCVEVAFAPLSGGAFPLPPAASLAFVSTPAIAGLLAALLVPPDHEPR